MSKAHRGPKPPKSRTSATFLLLSSAGAATIAYLIRSYWSEQPDDFDSFDAAMQKKDYDAALSVLEHGRVRLDRNPAYRTLLCDMTAAFIGTRKEVFRNLFLRLLDHGADVRCSMSVGSRAINTPLALALAHDASYSMLQAALRAGATTEGATHGGRPLTIGGGVLSNAAARSMVYGHIGLTLRLNPARPRPTMVRQFDLREHASLSPLLARYLDSRGDGALSLAESDRIRMADEVLVSFASMALDHLPPSAVFGSRDVREAISLGFPGMARLALRHAPDASLSDPSHAGWLPIPHLAHRVPLKTQLLAALREWAAGAVDAIEDGWGRTIADASWRGAWARREGEQDANAYAAHDDDHDGGWATEAGSESDGDAAACDIDEIWEMPSSSADFFKHYASVGRPVVLRGVARNWAFRKGLLTKEALLASHGDERWRVARVPYASMVGMPESMQTLREFVEREMMGVHKAAAHGASPSRPNYIFQNTADPRLMSIADELLRSEIAKVAAWTRPQRLQFFLGPGNSGAPLHSHTDAVNALAFGAKRWWLQPPDRAEFHTAPAYEWSTEHLQAYSAADRPLECTQRAGDLVYVPRSWAHATLNLRASVGFAVEFEAVY
jgi:hypothetical protein